jgi:hypothetical protein
MSQRGVFGYNLAGRATIIFFDRHSVGRSALCGPREDKKGGRELLTMCGIVRYVSEESGMPKEKSPIPVCRFGSHFQRR